MEHCSNCRDRFGGCEMCSESGLPVTDRRLTHDDVVEIRIAGDNVKMSALAAEEIAVRLPADDYLRIRLVDQLNQLKTTTA